MTTIALRRIQNKSRLITIARVLGFTAFTAICAQIAIPLGFTPVPISGQTIAVLLSGAVLGANLGASSQLLYVALGAIGMPIYQDATGGFQVIVGSTGGYLIGFIVASYIVGHLTERNPQNNLIGFMSYFIFGTMIVYIFGVTWLAHVANIPIVSNTATPDALSWGLTPFLIGDLIKVIVISVFISSIKYAQSANK